MRISADKDHADYHPFNRLCTVWLAGSERTGIVWADEEGRRALQHRLDDSGRPRLSKDGSSILIDEFFGDVRIDCPDWIRAECEAAAKVGKPAPDLDAFLYP